MSNTQKNVPELRFPGFEDEWEEKKIGDCCYKISDGIHSTPIYDEFGDYYFINGNNLVNGKIQFKTAKMVNSNEASRHSRALISNSTILLSINGTIGNVALYKGEKVLLGKSAAYLNINNKFLNTNYLYFFLSNRKIQKRFYREVTGTTIKNLSLKSIKETIINFPSNNEQQKIGDFFSKLDQQIELEEQKLATLEEQKKGYMQKLFSQELRFKDKNGNEYPEWEVIKLKDILSERKEYASKIGNYPHATLSTSGISLKSDRYNRDFLVKDKNKKYKVTIMNDICYNPANLKFGVITRNHIGSVIFSPIYITFEVNNAHSPLFIELLVTRNDFINRVRKYEEGTVYERMAVKPEDFLNYETKIPCLEEQEKIGDFFSILDKVINKQRHKIDELKLRKQGLLQKMFV